MLRESCAGGSTVWQPVRSNRLFLFAATRLRCFIAAIATRAGFSRERVETAHQSAAARMRAQQYARCDARVCAQRTTPAR
ncbi:hypothetical protein BSIN_2063 [Burkholderia singularis]|uniref:Uncharacterized protein n=1 Tax=Burkholderia singularis TaxID=1503053 RepID=A0A238H0N1_9BURK|nr:hypothetical protein BSIN_2063 [Burkholderia singularis]